MKRPLHTHPTGKHSHWLPVGLCALLLSNAVQARSSPPPPLSEPNDSEQGSLWLAASDRTLDQLRGGFDLGTGLLVSFGISRAVFINGQLITSTLFQIGDLSKLTAAQAVALSQQIFAQPQIVQNGLGNPQNSGSSTVPAALGQQVSTQSQVAQNGLGSPQNSGSATVPAALGQPVSTQPQVAQSGLGNTPNPGVVNGPAALVQQGSTQTLVVQNGPGNTLDPGALAVPLATFIQNTLSNQIIRNQTVIQASSNALGLVRNMNLQATISQAIANAIGNR